MQLTKVSKKNIVINQSTILVDWQKQLQETRITVRSGKNLVYFFIQGLGNNQRRTVTIDLAKRSTVYIYGIVIGFGHTKAQTDLSVIHRDRCSESSVVIRGICTDFAEADINGTVRISKKGSKSKARLEERILLLSPNARAKTIPNLEIEAHDVIASHAAAVSKISEEEIFYMQTRGISRKRSIRAIVASFLHSQITPLPESPIRAKLEAILYKTLKTINL